MNLQKYFSLKLNKSDLPDPTHQMFCLFCGVQRYLLVYIPPHKGKTVQATTFIWAYFLQMNLHLLTMNPPLPSVSIKSTKFDNVRTRYYPLYIISSNLTSALAKSESGSSYTSSSTCSITVFLLILPLDDEGTLPVTHRTHHHYFLARRLHPENQMIGWFCLI